MFKALTPIIGIVIAIGLFFSYIRPTFQDVKSIQNETAEYVQALEKASELQQRINTLKQKQSSISLPNLERLEALLPNRIDEVAVLRDLDTLATAHHLTLGDIKVGDKSADKTDGQNTQKQQTPANAPELSSGARGSQYTTLDISFSVSGIYNDFRFFLQEIESSLVLMEVTKIAFTHSEGDTIPFTLNARLYSLNLPAP